MNTKFWRRGLFDTAILGMWWGWNYGALLTSFALYKILQRLGYRPILLDHSTMSETWEKCSANNTPFRIFLSEYKIATYPVPTAKTSRKIISHISTFIVGSDQLWRYQYIREFGTQFFLDFVPSGKRKISYATSLGSVGAAIPEDFKQIASKLLTHFDAISVREFSGVDELKRLYNVNSVQVLDPVFLLGREDWLAVAKSCTILPNQSYLFSYILDNTDDTQNLISRLKSHFPHHFIVPDYTSSHSNESYAMLGNVLKKTDISTWLYAIANCDFFVTDSFHGACFAIIFNKPFVCLINEHRGATRFHTLQKLFPTLAHRFISTTEMLPAHYITQDFSEVNSHLHRERERSLSWLTKSLQCTTKPHDSIEGIRPCQKPGKLKIILSKIKQLITKSRKGNSKPRRTH